MTLKRKENDSEEKIKKQISDIANDMSSFSNEKTEQEQNNSKKQKTIPSKPNVSLKVPVEEKKEWEQFFSSIDLDLSKGIRKAVRFYIEQIKSGAIKG